MSTFALATELRRRIDTRDVRTGVIGLGYVGLPLAVEFARAGYTVLGWRVSDIAATVRGLGAKGIAFLRYDSMDQDESGIWTTPGGDQVAWFADPDGNVLSLTQFAF